jgi:hypothetical protein
VLVANDDYLYKQNETSIAVIRGLRGIYIKTKMRMLEEA